MVELPGLAVKLYRHKVNERDDRCVHMCNNNNDVLHQRATT